MANQNLDAFGRIPQALNGTLSSDRLFMSWPGLGDFGLGLIIQNVGVRYAQPIRRLHELGPGVIVGTNPSGSLTIDGSAAVCDATANVPSQCVNRTQLTYYVVGRTEGQFQLQRVVGPNLLTTDFYQTYGRACGGNTVSLTGRVGCTGDGSGPIANGPLYRWVMLGLLIGEYSVGASAQESFIQEGAGGMFTSLLMLQSA